MGSALRVPFRGEVSPEGSLEVGGWPFAWQQIPLQKASPHTANFSPERWVHREIPTPGDFYLLEVLLQVFCCQEGNKRGSIPPPCCCFSQAQLSGFIFKGYFHPTVSSVASQVEMPSSHFISAGLFSIPIRCGLFHSKLPRLPQRWEHRGRQLPQCFI